MDISGFLERNQNLSCVLNVRLLIGIKRKRMAYKNKEKLLEYIKKYKKENKEKLRNIVKNIVMKIMKK